MALSLGELTFGLGAETKGIERAIQRLVEFSRVVDQTAKSQEDGAQRAARALAQQETAQVRALNTLRQFRQLAQTLNTDTQIGVDFKSEQSRAATAAFNDLQRTLTNTKASFVEVSRAQALFDTRMKNRNKTK